MSLWATMAPRVLGIEGNTPKDPTDRRLEGVQPMVLGLPLPGATGLNALATAATT
jgi:hypothetical protein